ncbi:MAG TPA: type II secretion system protein M [Acidiferrobacteraceae bacterium]|nr:type II secretion system protein M [Acidiferrobacteraceae bacterium]
MNQNWRAQWEQARARYRSWWSAREPREQVLLFWGGWVAGALVLYLFVWTPLALSVQSLQREVPRNAVRLAKMQREAAEVQSLRQRAPKPVGGNLMTVLEQSATSDGLRSAIVRMEPDGRRRARVVLDHADFSGLVKWLADLQTRGIRVRRAQAERGTGVGQVSATLTLTEPRA